MGAKELEQVWANMARAAKRFDGDEREPPKLIAVSKTYGADDIVPVIEAGQRDFGENRVQEAQGKWPELRAQYPDLTLHLIGPLQTNKTKDAVALFDVIHSVDREKVARYLKKEMDAQGKNIPLFVQVNIGEEEQKSGIAPDHTVEFVRYCREDLGLDIQGLMAIPPVGEPAAPFFARLVELGKLAGLSKFSMGMSADYETAIEMGASYVRVGSAIFGARDYG
ncbi:YggS family pyridoxal phosphate-dependent enzyme [Maritalea mediterranea]|uniref:Pyridoxal phosphate homeostasis protein n=1 Tax=Maritalea mediterranea TaxID=2909667 RepID=A0ABS9E217_9HYPH|nr:YggS family pyridoxal phosphate-dependent enzyme [Maritalea mediterranea]MCF4096908.1 YggS family pyridoxal phosphate-dependent enzyme [Maritalea mediterranea]